MIQPQSPAIKPHKEGCLRNLCMYAGQIPLAEVSHCPHILRHVFEHLTPPLLSMTVGGDSGDIRHHRSRFQFACLKPAVETIAYLIVGHHREGADDSRDVEGLGRRTECYAVVEGIIRHGGKRSVCRAVECHIGMNLVRHHQQVLPAAYLGKTAQLFGAPYTSCRVVRISQQQYAPLRIETFKGIVVNIITPGIIRQHRYLHHVSPVAFRYDTEWMVDRRHDHDIITRLCKHVDHQANPLHNSGYIAQPFRTYLPAVELALPIHN